MTASTDLRDALNIHEYQIYFQPVTDLGSLQIVGVEELLRPISINGELMSPGAVIEDARKTGLLADLDEEARIAAIAAFANKGVSEEIVLFLNYSAETWVDRPLDLRALESNVRSAGIDPSRVAIEFVESQLPDHLALETVANDCRDAGFMISLDDFGTRHSNLERVVSIAPDIIKIDRSVTTAAQNDRSKCTLLRSITYLAQTMGALSLAEGVESYDDLYTCSRIGVGLAQGFLIGRPSAQILPTIERGAQAVEQHRSALKNDLAARIKNNQLLGEHQEDVIATVVDHLALVEEKNLEEALRTEIASIDGAECGYVVDLEGIQTTPCVPTDDSHSKPTMAMNHVGRNLILKDFIYGPLVLGRRRFVSTNSFSRTPGRSCYTISTRFTTADKTELILCVNLSSGGA